MKCWWTSWTTNWWETFIVNVLWVFSLFHQIHCLSLSSRHRTCSCWNRLANLSEHTANPGYREWLWMNQKQVQILGFPLNTACWAHLSSLFSIWNTHKMKLKGFFFSFFFIYLLVCLLVYCLCGGVRTESLVAKAGFKTWYQDNDNLESPILWPYLLNAEITKEKNF